MTVRHARSIERDEDGEYAYSCACGTGYQSRIQSWADAVRLDVAHKAAVDDGTWQAEQDTAEAERVRLAPVNAAKRAHFDAVDDYRSACFGVAIARHKDGDVDAAMAERARLADEVETTRDALAAAEKSRDQRELAQRFADQPRTTAAVDAEIARLL